MRCCCYVTGMLLLSLLVCCCCSWWYVAVATAGDVLPLLLLLFGVHLCASDALEFDPPVSRILKKPQLLRILKQLCEKKDGLHPMIKRAGCSKHDTQCQMGAGCGQIFERTGLA